MKKRHYYVIAFIAFWLGACHGGKKQTLEPEQAEVAEVAPRDSMQRSAVVYNAAEETMISKVEKPQSGKKVVSPRLVKLDLVANGLEEKEIILDEFYKKVSYIPLNHPLSDKGMGFLGDAGIHVYTKHEKGESSSSMRGFNSSVFLTDNHIVAGDKYLGYHVYGKEGDFVYTLASRDKLPEYNIDANAVSYSSNEVKGQIRRFSIWGNNALIQVTEDSAFCTHIYDIELQKGIRAFRKTAPAFMINKNVYLAYNRNTNIKKDEYYLGLISYSGQESSLRAAYFRNYNPEAATKGRRSDPESHSFTYYNDTMTTRQAYNDTIYRIKNANTLEAAYVLNSGAMKLSNADAFSENKEGKLIISDWLETDDFMFITATVDQDFPNNRTENKVKFRYYYYNKKDAKLYLKEGNAIYPEEYTFACNIEGAIPVLANTAKQHGKKLYTSYTKSQLKKIIDRKACSSEQQAKLQSLYEELSEGGLLVVLFE